MDQLRKFWELWKKVGQAIGDFIGRLVLTVFYFTLFVPFGLGVRLLMDPLRIKSTGQPNWIKRQHQPETLDTAKRQF